MARSPSPPPPTAPAIAENPTRLTVIVVRLFIRFGIDSKKIIFQSILLKEILLLFALNESPMSILSFETVESESSVALVIIKNAEIPREKLDANVPIEVPKINLVIGISTTINII